VNFFNDTKPTATKFDGLNKEKNNSYSLDKFYRLSSSAV